MKAVGEALPSRSYPCKAHVERTNGHDILCAFILSTESVSNRFFHWNNGRDVHSINCTDGITNAFLFAVVQFLRLKLRLRPYPFL